jgi:hypothetical protein
MSNNIASISEIATAQSQRDRMSQNNNENVNFNIKPNEEQCVLLCTLRDITKQEKKELLKIGLKMLEVDGKTMSHVDLIKLQDCVDCIILDCRDKDAFQILRKNFQSFKDNFNVCLLQREGYLSDKSFAENFESITKSLNLDALDPVNWKKSLCQKPYLSRPVNKWVLLVKKILRMVFKL